MTTIEVNGKKEQAYDLIMRKEHALDIIAGKKPLEIRAFSDHYYKMFTDEKVLAENKKLQKEGREDEIVEPVRIDIQYIHFHNYNNSWTLDVEVDALGTCLMTEDEIKWLSDEFDFHDYDNEWQQYADVPDDEKPMFFWLHIVKVVNKQGI